MKKIIASLFCIMLPSITLFAGLSGEYRVKGFDPTAMPPAPYTGTVSVTKVPGVNNLYNFIWSFDNTTVPDLGLGLKVGNQISIVFQNNPQTYSGVQVYTIKCNVLKGPWVYYGDTRVGTETIKKIGRR
jgi:hypothetical protein